MQQIKALHRILRLMRTAHGLTQKDLAGKLSLSTSHLSEIESGKKTPTLAILKGYADSFQVPVWGIVLLAENADSGFDHLNSEGLESVGSSKLVALIKLWKELGSIKSSLEPSEE